MRIDIIAGARPNFIKIAPLIEAIKEIGEPLSYRLIHTGQHYDKNMSESFFEQLGIPEPDINLGAGGGTQAEQTANIMIGYEKLLASDSADLCLVVGDVNSTMACSIVARKMGLEVAHVEGGIRSGDWSMPEEVNRIVTDSLTNYFFTTSSDANRNLQKSGVPIRNIYFVGNTMIDTLLKHKSRFFAPEIWKSAGLSNKSYFVLTLHRPSNVDDAESLVSLLQVIVKEAKDKKIVFPVHPRTRKILEDANYQAPEKLIMIDPLSYLEFNYLVENSFAVITDSGGITEETTVLGIPCLTLRDTTERPETVSIGTNELVGTDPDYIKPAFAKLFSGKWKKGEIPELWDGKTGKRIAEALLEIAQW